MKNIIIKILLILSIFSISGINIVGNTYAEDEGPGLDYQGRPEDDDSSSRSESNSSSIPASNSSSSSSNGSAKNPEIIVTVTEKIPGAGCKEDPDSKNDKGEVTLYKCTIKPGFGTVISMLGSMIKYFTFLAGLGGVLFIVYNGIMYSMGGAEQSLKDDAKKRIIQTLIGLVVLFLSGIILNLVAPWVYVV